ncbi:hypothetical protein QR680_000910 [Steinernema hermaphroditum]|uniref:BTB domain-containing protein n=1 Tax=Steinernema hermaphroditum TaxID=289476 RepID=A0AA39GX16_9BILA|nr:hypothetical protein QR680_000910 [Steinernema hermaphroditum]
MPKVHTRVTLEKSGWKFRRLEQVLHVHPEKYRARSNRNTRNNTPVSHVSQRSHSIDYMNSSVSDNLTASRLDSSSGKCHVPMIPEEHDPEKPVHIPLNPNRLHYHAGHTGDIVTINVAGLKFQTWESTLERFPDSLLGHPVKRSKFWNPKRQEYFIDRHRSCFEAMLYIYQSGGRIRRPESVPIDLFLRELKFYQMGDEVLEQFWISEGYEKPKENLMPKNSYQRRLWELMEYPDSSLSARIVAFISVFVIVTSIISFCLETIPELKPSNEGRDWSNPFFWIEFICIIWFSIELFLRFLSCPSKISFLKSFLNIVDFIAIAPFFVNLVCFHNLDRFRHSVGLQILGKTFRASIQEFCLLIFFMVIALVLFSSGVYFAEQSEPNTKFTSIPASFWFVLVTMTTVGYGDLVPVGTYGKLVGSCCALIGVLTLALPVPIIVANFKHFYRQETRLATMRASREHDENSTASLDSDDEDDSIS